MDPRTTAATIITPVILRQQSLATTMPEGLAQHANKQDHPFIKELCYGTMRWFNYLEFIAGRLLKKPLKENDQDIYAAVLIGLYQIIKLRVPDHAAIDNTVNVAKELRKKWATGLINAILRSFQRQQNELLEAATRSEGAHYSHPIWLLQIIKKAWPTEWQNILLANNQPPPLFLRVNQQKITLADYQTLLAENDILAEPITDYSMALHCKKPVATTQLPKFAEGYVSIQDLHAQLAAVWLDINPSQRVLDACAAPGGKTSHLLEHCPALKELVALDQDPLRLNQVTTTLERLGLTAKLICADARDTGSWWDGQFFDRILLDAPCSGTGVIRRHPDIKLLRRKPDIANYAKTQKELLAALWPLLAPGGMLLYATCSILPQENSDVIEYFLQATPDCEHQPIVYSAATPSEYGCQLLTTPDGGDGFYYAKLTKQKV